MRLAVKAPCKRPAVVCIAAATTCQQWTDVEADVVDSARTLRKQPQNAAGQSNNWIAQLTGAALIKGLRLLIVKPRQILMEKAWYTKEVSSMGTFERSDYVFLITNGMDDAQLILSQFACGSFTRYVVVIMRQIENSGGGYAAKDEYVDDVELMEEVGQDVDQIVVPESDHFFDKSGALSRTHDRRPAQPQIASRMPTPTPIPTSPQGHNDKCAMSAHNLLRLLWAKQRMLRVAVIRTGCNRSGLYKPGQTSTTAIYLLGHSGEPVTLAGEDTATALRLLSQPLEDLGGRSLRIALFERIPTVVLVSKQGEPRKFAGQDAWLLRLMAHHFNFRVRLHQHDENISYGYSLENGTSTGALSQLMDGTVDICFNGFFVMDYGTHKVQFSVPFSTDSLCILVPRRPALPRWSALLLTLPPLLFATAPPLAVFIILLSWFSRRLLRLRGSVSADLSTVISMCLTVPTRLPDVCSQRLLFSGIMIASLVVMGAFQGLVVRSLSHPQFTRQIDSLEELADSGLPIITGTETFSHTFDVPEGTPEMQQLNKRTLVLRSPDPIPRPNAARIVRRSGYETYLASEYHMVEECPRQYPIAFLMRQGSPLGDHLDMLILRLAASGMIELLEGYTQQAKEHFEDNSQRIFTLKDLEDPFALLAYGLGISSAILSWEIMYHMYRKRQRMQ